MRFRTRDLLLGTLLVAVYGSTVHFGLCGPIDELPQKLLDTAQVAALSALGFWLLRQARRSRAGKLIAKLSWQKEGWFSHFAIAALFAATCFYPSDSKVPLGFICVSQTYAAVLVLGRNAVHEKGVLLGLWIYRPSEYEFRMSTTAGLTTLHAVGRDGSSPRAFGSGKVVIPRQTRKRVEEWLRDPGSSA
ncbi:MAG: hypothetical protein AAFV43_06420 [Planctomycetota bacterium]